MNVKDIPKPYTVERESGWSNFSGHWYVYYEDTKLLGPLHLANAEKLMAMLNGAFMNGVIYRHMEQEFE